MVPDASDSASWLVPDPGFPLFVGCIIHGRTPGQVLLEEIEGDVLSGVPSDLPSRKDEAAHHGKEHHGDKGDSDEQVSDCLFHWFLSVQVILDRCYLRG